MGVTTATASAVSSGGLLSLLLSSTSLLPDEDVPRPIVPATPDHAIFTPWPSEVRSHLADGAPTDPECQFWNASIQYSSQLCTHFSLSRVAVSAAERGVARAVQCASRHDLDCVLSPEIGLSIPAAFVYDVHAGMQMIVAPRLLPHESEQSLVRIATPAGVATPRALLINHTVVVEYLPGGSRAPVTEQLTDAASYCVQALRDAYEAGCWENLD